MKKKFILLLIIIIGIFAINVYADPDDTTGGTDPDTTDPEEDEEDDYKAWPKSYTYTDKNNNEFGYTIEGVTLNVYRLDTTKTVQDTVVTSSGTTTIEKNSDLEKYIKGEPSRIISLDPTKYTINPTVNKEKDILGGIPTTVIDLKLNITKEKIKELVQAEFDATTPDVQYIIEIAVNYKLTDYPAKYVKAHNYNLMRILYGTLYGTFGNDTSEMNNFDTDLSGTISQVVNVAVIAKKDASSETEIGYETTLSSDNNIAGFVYNFLCISEEEIPTDKEPDPTKTQQLMFHNVDNIQYLIDNINEINSNMENYVEDNSDFNNVVKSQEVQVPNTALNKNKLWVMVGTISILTGIMLITYTLKMIQFRKFRKQETI